MKIRRFFAKDMRSGLAQVTKELGSDAAILSTNNVNGGIEIVAATDYEQAMAAARKQKQESDEALLASSLSSSSQATSTQPNSSLATSSNSYLPSYAEMGEDKVNLRGRSESSSKRKLNSQAASNFKSAQQSKFKNNAKTSSKIKPPAQPGAQPRTESLVEPIPQFDLTDATAQSKNNDKYTNSLSRGQSQNMAASISAASKQKNFEWGQDPVIAGVQQELELLRSLLQTQLADLSWTRKMETDPVNVEIMRRLVSMELPVLLSEKYATKIESHEIGEAWYKVAAMLAHDINISELDPVEQGGCYALVGPTGVGKTTTVAKMAAIAALKYGSESVAMISTDSYRIAAHEQLKIYGQILNIPVVSVANAEELEQTLDHFENRRLILIDTAGVGQRDQRLAEQVNCLTGSRQGVKNLLVLSATAQTTILSETVQSFRQLELAGAILTKLDETTSLGPVITALIRTQLPLSFITDGQNVPDDIHRAKAHQLVTDAISLANSYPLEKDEEWRIAQGLSSFLKVS